MINGLYSSAAAMQVLAEHQDIITDNLMNANSSGHRRVVAGVQQSFDENILDLTLDLGPEIESRQRDFQQGRNVRTERPLDLMIQGDGFFVFEKDGGTILSRNGRVYRDPDQNVLVNHEGLPLQGEGGPIPIDPNIPEQSLAIASDGTISANGSVLGKVRTVAYEDNQNLLPVGTSEFLPGPESVESTAAPKVVQYHHETSNVQPVSELVALIINNRQHQALEKATRAISDSLKEYIRT